MRKTAAERFWSRVDKQGPVHRILRTRCWLWTGAPCGGGYAQFLANGKKVMVHRFSYELAYGPLGDLEVDHRCFVNLCVRPSHLRSVTRKQNNEHLTGARQQSKTGIRGVRRKGNGYAAEVKHNGKSIHIGMFGTVAEAGAAAEEARETYFTNN